MSFPPKTYPNISDFLCKNNSISLRYFLQILSKYSWSSVSFSTEILSNSATNLPRFFQHFFRISLEISSLFSRIFFELFSIISFKTLSPKSRVLFLKIIILTLPHTTYTPESVGTVGFCRAPSLTPPHHMFWCASVTCCGCKCTCIARAKMCCGVSSCISYFVYL